MTPVHYILIALGVGLLILLAGSWRALWSTLTVLARGEPIAFGYSDVDGTMHLACPGCKKPLKIPASSPPKSAFKCEACGLEGEFSQPAQEMDD